MVLFLTHYPIFYYIDQYNDALTRNITTVLCKTTQKPKVIKPNLEEDKFKSTLMQSEMYIIGSRVSGPKKQVWCPVSIAS